jgi:prepilin-type N-terminal cleavage/methylation domain-containing protein
MHHRCEHSATAGRTNNGGFSLVEALVVVMIVLVIAAIAIPGFVQARMKAHEASAVSSMRTIASAELLYSQSYPLIGFSRNLADLGSRGTTCGSLSPSNACILTDEALASGYKSGYVFQLISDGQTPSVGYTLNGIPENTGVSGRCTFRGDQSGNITFTVTGNTTLFRYSLGSGTTTCYQ